MTIEQLQAIYKPAKESALSGRYITNAHIKPLLDKYLGIAKVDVLGQSVKGDAIFSITIGNGDKRVLMWSQMHGNESTTTKAIFDFLNACTLACETTTYILKNCTLLIIPILNPDGAKAYTRVNANGVDLNRDAHALTQPESNILNTVFKNFKPHFCFNLHGQRTIFGAGSANFPATVSFLAPAQDSTCTVTPNRKVAMQIIAKMNCMLQHIIPNQVGVYDDAFNINCVGDTFQAKHIPTILFEAGHYSNDYLREKTREFIFISYITALHYIVSEAIDGKGFEPYFDIPENEKTFFDVIIKNANVKTDKTEIVDIAFQFEERLVGGAIEFIPKVVKIENELNFFAHKTIDAKGEQVSDLDNNRLEIDSENVFVKINNMKIALFSK